MSATALIGQAPTNLGPLITTFTPPPECTVAVGAGRGGFLGDLFGGGNDQSIAYLGQACSRNRAIDNTACWPPTTAGPEPKEAPLNGWGFYSPGLHCPGGYATACAATGGSGGGSEWPVQFRLLAGETAVGCCPSGYGCANINGQTCVLAVTSSSIPTVTCDGTKSGNFGFQTVPDPEASITAFSLFAPMIQINWQSTDHPTATTSSPTDIGPTASSKRATTSNPLVSASGTKVIDTEDESAEETLVLDNDAQATGTGRVSTGNQGAPGLSSDPADTGSREATEGLSSNVKVGLGVVGASVGLLAFVVGLFWCWRRKKNAEEEQELDRLYGQKTATGSTNDLTRSNEIPGWYRGQRLATPTNREPFFRESLREMPAEPYQQGGSPYFRDAGYRV